MLPMVSFAVNVMVTMSFTFAKDGLVLLLDIVRSSRDGSIVSITVLLLVISFWVTLSIFPVLSYAVMLNSTGPFVEPFTTVKFGMRCHSLRSCLWYCLECKWSHFEGILSHLVLWLHCFLSLQVMCYCCYYILQGLLAVDLYGL